MRLFLPRPWSTWLVTSVLAISFVSVYPRAYVLHGESGSGVGSPMFQFPRLHSTREQRAARADTRASVCTTLAERGMRSTGAFPFRPPFTRFSSSSRPTSRPESRERERERERETEKEREMSGLNRATEQFLEPWMQKTRSKKSAFIS